MKTGARLFGLLLTLAVLFTGCSPGETGSGISSKATPMVTESPRAAVETPPPSPSPPPFDLAAVPAFSGAPYVEVNGNVPYFTGSDSATDSFENYAELDSLGRCGAAFACIGVESMPTGERGGIGMIKPSGWQTVRYDDLIDGMYLYNRCHLIGYRLAGENANERNLITGTRYLNVEGMLPFETQVAEYVEQTENHVLYRVTPFFEGDNLLASGVLMEALSVEDNGAGVRFCVYAYNSQPGIQIEYASGESGRSATPIPEPAESQENASTPAVLHYIGNANTRKFHYPDCSSVKQMKESNKVELSGTRDEIITTGYDPCKRCNP